MPIAASKIRSDNRDSSIIHAHVISFHTVYSECTQEYREWVFPTQFKCRRDWASIERAIPQIETN